MANKKAPVKGSPQKKATPRKKQFTQSPKPKKAYGK